MTANRQDTLGIPKLSDGSNVRRALTAGFMLHPHASWCVWCSRSSASVLSTGVTATSLTDPRSALLLSTHGFVQNLCKGHANLLLIPRCSLGQHGWDKAANRADS